MVASSLSLAGALRITRSAPASRCFCSFTRLVKKPVDSSATWHPRLFQGSLAGSLSVRMGIDLPLTTRAFSAAWTVPANCLWTLSYLSRTARCLGSARSLIATTSYLSGCWARTRNTRRPIRPKPLIPTRTAMTGLLVHLTHTREKLCLIRQCLLDHFRRSDPVGVAAPSIVTDRGPEHAHRDRLFAVPHPRINLADQTDFFVDSQGFGPVLARHLSPSAALKLLCCCSNARAVSRAISR